MKKKKIGVLVFPAGEINSVELHDALATCVNIELYGVSSIDKHGGYIFKNYISGLPMVNEENFFKELNRIIEENQIDVVFPTHDTVAMIFAENQEKIKAKVIVSDPITAEICRDKKKIYHLFKEEDFCPKIYDHVEEFPIFMKPREGQGAVNVKLIKEKQDLQENINFDEWVICEYLPGDEYTIDCFTDRYGKLQIILPRSRKRLLAGVTVSSTDEEITDEMKYMAEQINQKLHFRGLWWFQAKKDKDGKIKLLEISTRCAGTMCMARAKGVNLPLLSVYDAMDWNIELLVNPYHIKMDRTLISRYSIDYRYKTVYIDFDDTIVVRGHVYLPAISFLYQCKSEKKKVILITKHLTDIYQDLEEYCICSKLFDEIIVIHPEEEKVDYIDETQAIFIDNAFAERRAVWKRYGIPVFDVDGIEVLRDWRI